MFLLAAVMLATIHTHKKGLLEAAAAVAHDLGLAHSPCYHDNLLSQPPHHGSAGTSRFPPLTTLHARCVPHLQVRGVEALKDFGVNLLQPYKPAPSAGGSSREAELEAEVAALKKRVAELEGQLAAAKR